MSSTLMIQETIAWMPRFGTFDRVLNGIADRMELRDRNLAAEIRYPVDKYAYFSLIDWDSKKFNLFVDCVCENLAIEIHKNEPVASDISWDVIFLRYYIELKTLLIRDERYRDRVCYDQEGTIIIDIDKERQWSTSGWIYDLVLENFAASGKIKDQALITLTMQSRIAEATNRFDLQKLNADQCQCIAETRGWLYRFYDGTGRVSVAHGTNFFGVLGAKIHEFYELTADFFTDYPTKF